MKKVFLVLSTLIFTMGSNTNALCFTVPSMKITIDGRLSDWAGAKPILIDTFDDKEMEGTEGADIKAFYVAKDGTYLYMMMTLYDGRPNRFVQYNFYVVDDTSGVRHPVTGAFTLDDRTTWISNTLSPNEVQKTYSGAVGLGINAIEWAIPLTDFPYLKRPIVYASTGKVTDGSQWYDEVNTGDKLPDGQVPDGVDPFIPENENLIIPTLKLLLL